MPAADPPPFDLTLAREAFTSAGALHRQATLQGGPCLTAEDLDALAEHDAAFVTALTEGRVQDAIAADDRFHQVFLTATGDPDLQVSVDLIGPRLRRMDLFVFTRKSFSDESNSHPPIIAALRAGDVATAADLVQRSFTDAGEALAAALERTGR